MGNLQEVFPLNLTLVAKEPCQIRHTALEAARGRANRFLLKVMGKERLPSEAQGLSASCPEENKQATGAGADRVSSGMRMAFGKAVGTAAQVVAVRSSSPWEFRPST